MRKDKYAGLEVDQVRQMAQLQEEKLQLKQLVVEQALDKTMLSDVLAKNGKAFAAWTDGRTSGGKLPSKRAASLPCTLCSKSDLSLSKLPRYYR